MDFKYKCKTCLYAKQLQDGSYGCTKFNIKIDLNKDGCSWHKLTGTPCCICGKPEDNLIVLYGTDNTVYPFCQNCYQYYHTCQLCQNANICGFMDDHSEPQVINQTVRQGFMVIQQQVKNPKLIDKHCTVCKCGNNKNCNKDTNGVTCSNWQLKIIQPQ